MSNPDHQTTVSSYEDGQGFVYAAWRCSCGDKQGGYLKHQYADNEARMHVAEARREEHHG